MAGLRFVHAGEIRRAHDAIAGTKCQAPLDRNIGSAQNRPMTPKQALRYYRTRTAMAEAAEVSRQAVAQWFKAGAIPAASAGVLAAKSRGHLKFDWSFYRKELA